MIESQRVIEQDKYSSNLAYWRQSPYNHMELYHQTLLSSNNHKLCLALHAYPIKPKEEYERPRQLLLATTNSLQLYRPQPGLAYKHDLRLIHEESLFSSICAMEAVVYQDDDLRKDIVLVTLANGKYQLLEWIPNKTQFAVIDQNLIFSDEQEITSGLVKPTPGHLIAVNEEAKLVLIASHNYQARLYQRTLGYQGIRLSPLAYLARPQTSICLQIVPGQGNTLFYMLRKELVEEKKIVRIFKLKRVQEELQEEPVCIDDSGIHLIRARTADGAFFAVGQKYLYYTNKGKISQMKIPQPKPSFQTCAWRRLRDKKDDFLMLNENGELTTINFDDTNNIPCSINYVESALPALDVAALDKNTFFLLSSSAPEHILIEATGKYRIEDRVEKTRSSIKMKEEKEKEEGKGSIKEFEVVGSLQTGRVIRDMKISSLEKGMNNEILLTGGRPRSKRGFLSVIKYGLKLKSHLNVSSNVPQGIWAIKQHVSEKYHSYIVIAFNQRKTSTFYYDGSKLHPKSDLRLDQNQQTLHLVKFGDNSLVQVAPSKIKFISKEGNSRDIIIKGRIMRAASVSEGRQLFLSLVGGFVEYYQVQAGEMRKLKEINLEAEANHIEFAPPEVSNDNKLYSRLLVVGLTNYHIQIYAVSPKGLDCVAFRNIKVSIESMVLVPHLDDNYCIYAGAHNGRSFKWTVSRAGQHISLEDEVVGERVVKYSKITVQGKQALFRLSPEPSITYQWQGQLQTCGLPLPNVDQIEEILIQTTGGSFFITYFQNYIRILEVYGFGNLLYTSDKDLDQPGKKILMLQDRLGVLTQSKNEDNQSWVSNFLFLNPSKEYEIEKTIAFDPHERVLSVASVVSKEGRNLICFGCCMNHGNLPKPAGRFPSIKIYNYEKNQLEITVSHLFNFPLDGPPTAMDIYLGKLLVGVEKKLMLFDIFKQKLIVRATSDTLDSPVCSLHVCGQKIFMTQIMESFSLLKINHKSKSFDLVGQDFLERFTTCSCLIDEEAGLMAGADKFGNIFLSKMSEKMKAELEEIKEGSTQAQIVNNTPNYMDSLVSYHLGEVVTSIECGKIDPKKPERIFYCTIDGKVGMFYPMESEEEAQLTLLRRMEEEMTKSNVAGASNHKLFRNQFNPEKGVVDGDFCELFQSLSQHEKQRLSGALGKEPKELMSLLDQMKNKFS